MYAIILQEGDKMKEIYKGLRSASGRRAPDKMYKKSKPSRETEQTARAWDGGDTKGAP